MHPTNDQRDRRRLAEKLREMRERAGVSGSQFAARHGWVQPRVSRIETGKQLPTEEDIHAWADLLDSPADVREELLEALRRARVEHADWREAFRRAGSAAAAQADIGAREAQTTYLRKFLPAMIPGLLQTSAYSRELLALPSGPAAHGATEDEIAEMHTARMQRQQILYDPGRRIEIVVMEAALQSRLCSDATMAGQLDRLAAAATAMQESLTFGVIPVEQYLPAYPLTGFTIFDEHLVVIETLVGEQRLSADEDIATYVTIFELLRAAAATGRDAVPVIQRAPTSRGLHA